MSKSFVVLSMYEVHMASASIMVDGVVKAACHEERFSRLKNDVGFPLLAAQYCMKEAGISPLDIDEVAICNHEFNKNGVANIMFKRPATYTIDEWLEENSKYWYPTLVGGKKIDTYFDLMGGLERVKDHYYDFSSVNFKDKDDAFVKNFNQIRRDTVELLLGIPKDKVVFYPHYKCHHYHSYYSGSFRNDDVVIVHQEGDGGKYNSGVSIPTNKGLKWLGGSNQSDVGRLYQWITLLMGMKPYHHEYKLMGLAPYATEYEVNKTFKEFSDIFQIDKKSLSIVYKNKPNDLYFHFKDLLSGHRFDGIAGALQLLTEETLSLWLKQVLKITKKSTVCYGGGVAMNVKANGILSQLPEVKSLFVPISPGDETNVFGVAYWATERHLLKQGKDPREHIPALETVYLGPKPNDSDLSSAIIEKDIKSKGFFIKEKIKNNEIAKILSQGDVIGRMCGRSEYGQRSLGNRSILANPSLPGTVEKINKQIKYRDFWMPFCPTILDSYANKCLDNPKNIPSRYMTMSFPVLKDFRESIQGGIHSGDSTARPQILSKDDNIEYYNLIESFNNQTKVGALINTSFNMHGEPIVGQPIDALNTLIKSDLDGVLINNTFISRKKVKED